MPTARPPTTTAGLRIQLLGGFQVTVGDRPVPAPAWSLRKAASLVKLLALAAGHRLHREQVLDRLWPDRDPGAAANNLDQVLHVARRALDPVTTRRSPYLQREGEVLALRSPGTLWIDVAAFEAAASVARHVDDPAVAWTAIERYTGDLLPEDAYEEWAADRREALRQAYQGLLLAVARLHGQRGERERAITALQRLLASEPAHEAAHRHLMRLYAETGQHDQAVRQYGYLKESLRRDLDVEPDAVSQRLYEQLVALRAAAPSLTEDARVRPPATVGGEATPAPAAPPPSNLPAPLTSFVGRARDLAEVQALLGETRLLTLAGSGGVGKTRLALEAARAVQADYSDGVWLVELAALADPRLVPQAVATALGVAELLGQLLTETLAGHLAAKRLLLVLDNCEHLLAACGSLAETLLCACPHLCILATSRQALNVAGEVVWRVPSLAVPPTTHLPPPDELSRVGAVRLLYERARAVRPAFAITPANAPAVARVCVHLDGIPLALELAAARLQALTVEQLAARVDDRLRLLTGGRQTALPRQQTLRATIDWSYGLLTAAEQLLFRRLAVFAGGWTLEAAEAVGAGDGVEHGEVLDLLVRLVDKSLVQVEEQGGEARYRLLETVRQYAGERLAEAGEEQAVRQRHRDWYLALADADETTPKGPEQLAWFGRLEVEHDNVRAALAWCLEHDPEKGLWLAGSLWAFWWLRSHFTEGQDWLERLLVRTAAPTAARTRALRGAGSLAGGRGDVATARARYEEALALSRELGEPGRTSFSLLLLGDTLIYLGEYRQARTLLEEALPLSRTRGPYPLGANLVYLGRLAEREGDYRRARRLLEEALPLLQAVPDEWLVSGVLADLGRASLSIGEDARAEALFEDALAKGRDLGSNQLVMVYLLDLGRVACWRGDLERATERYEVGLALARELKNAWWTGWAVWGQGQVMRLQGKTVQATTLLQESLTLSTRGKNKPAIAAGLYELGLTAWSEGSGERALAFLRESLVLRHEMGERPGIAACLEGLAIVATGMGQTARAARLLGAAEALRGAMGAPLPPVERPDYEATVHAARAALGEPAFRDAWVAGQALTLEQAVAEALASEAQG